MEMFEQPPIEEMTFIIFVEKSMADFIGSDRFGGSALGIVAGWNHVPYQRCVNIIVTIDRLLLSCPRHWIKRVKSYRNSFVSAEMMKDFPLL